MATRNPKAKKTPQTANQRKAAEVAAQRKQDQQARASQPRAETTVASAAADHPMTTDPALGEYTYDTLATAASIANNLPRPENYTGPVGAAVEDRRARIAQAVTQREAAARRATEVQQVATQIAEVEQHLLATVDANPLPRAPLTNAMQKPAASAAPPGIHPDVTSPTNADFAKRPPGTGVAALEDLAPGQDITPCGAMGSSNIVPLPDKPGEPFSAL